MIIQIEHISPVPIYEQLASEIVRMIESGSLIENDSLPPIRQLASQLDIAANTVARAYQELERKGMIISNGRKGTFIKKITKPESSSGFKTIIISLIQKGYDRKEIEQLFNENIHQIFN